MDPGKLDLGINDVIKEESSDTEDTISCSDASSQMWAELSENENLVTESREKDI